MKKNFKYAILGAIALGGAVGFSACSSSDEIVDNPNYNPETNAVKTQFTISFQNSVVKTRQSADVVQENTTNSANPISISDFRGMDNIVLYPFVKEGTKDQDPILSTDTKLGTSLSLTQIIEPENVDISAADDNNTIPAGQLLANSNSVLYNDVSIPVGTGSFLFYGKAKDKTGSSNDNFVNGTLAKAETGTTAGGITFSPVQINSAEEVTKGSDLATYLSNIAKATHWAECADDANNTTANVSWFNSGLGALYSKFITMKAGSSKTAQAAVQDLYTTILNNTDEVSVAIKTAITDANYVTSSGGTVVFKDAINGFPGNVNLPDGAAMLSYDSTNKEFSQVVNGTGNTGTTTTDDSTTPPTVTNKVTAAYADYVYPASLYYYCNSGIVTSNSSQKSAYNGTNSWATIIDPTRANGYNLTAVGPATRSVAIIDQIQYAVGRLDMTVKTATNNVGGKNILYDKKGEPYDASAGFTVTGVLIGGQKPVNYDFTTNTTGTTYTIYDNISISNGALTATTTASDLNYTLALETYHDAVVYVAVELVNDGADFEGADGVVPAGCKFYLVAELDPNAATGITNTNSLDQVFIQDYKTRANFTIPAGYSKDDTNFPVGGNNIIGLAKAYNTVPDLRAPKMELGLSVDLTWQQGIQYDIDLGTE